MSVTILSLVGIFSLLVIWTKVERITVHNETGERLDSVRVGRADLGRFEADETRSKWIWGRNPDMAEVEVRVHGHSIGTVTGQGMNYAAGTREVTVSRVSQL